MHNVPQFINALETLLSHNDKAIVKEALNIWSSSCAKYKLFIEILANFTGQDYKDGHLETAFLEENFTDVPHKKMILLWLQKEAARFPELNLGFSFDEMVVLLKSKEFSNVVMGTSMLDSLVDSYEQFTSVVQTLTKGKLVEQKFSQAYFTARFKSYPFPDHMAFWCLQTLHSFARFEKKLSLRTVSFNGKFEGGRKVNPLRRLPDINVDFSFVLRFSARMNTLTQLPDWFEELENVEHVDLEHNELKSFPEQLFTLSNVTKLKLKRNAIPAIPDEIAQLQKLESLDVEEVSGNRWYRPGLKQISDKIGLCTKLTRLNIRGCSGIDGEHLKSILPNTCSVTGIR